MRTLLTILAPYWAYIAAAVAVVVGYFGVKKVGADQARTEDAAEAAKQTEQAQQTTNKVENDVARKSDDAVLDESIRDWVRRE